MKANEIEMFETLQKAANEATENKKRLILDCSSMVMSEIYSHKTDLLIDLLWNTNANDLKRIFKLK